jgi:hypothetical protein
LNESPEERTPSDHDPGDQRGGGGEGGLSGAAPGVEEEATPEGEESMNEPGPGEPAEGDEG